jgi:hypothetical protein
MIHKVFQEGNALELVKGRGLQTLANATSVARPTAKRMLKRIFVTVKSDNGWIERETRDQ